MTIWRFLKSSPNKHIWLVHQHGNLHVISYQLICCPICNEPVPSGIALQSALLGAHYWGNATIEAWNETLTGSISLDFKREICNNLGVNKKELEKEFLTLVTKYGHMGY